MSDCPNFKSPSELGLRICTSDIFCYDGANFECLDVPSNPTLNDIIAAIDASTCNILNLIDNIVVPTPVLPSDPWVSIDELDPKITLITTTGSVAWNSLTFDVTYRVLSESHAIVKVKAFADVNVTQIDDLIQFSIGLANIPNADSSWFSSGEKRFQTIHPFAAGNSYGVPLTYSKVGGDALPTHQFDYDIMGRAAISNGIIFAQNITPKINTGNHVFLIEFEMLCGLETI